MSTWQTRREIAGPGDQPGVSRFNDDALEIAIALWRGIALIATPIWCVLLVITLADPHPRRWWSLAGVTVVGALFWWLGFWQFGNADWRKRGRGGDDLHP